MEPKKVTINYALLCKELEKQGKTKEKFSAERLICRRSSPLWVCISVHNCSDLSESSLYRFL